MSPRNCDCKASRDGLRWKDLCEVHQEIESIYHAAAVERRSLTGAEIDRLSELERSYI